MDIFRPATVSLLVLVRWRQMRFRKQTLSKLDKLLQKQKNR